MLVPRCENSRSLERTRLNARKSFERARLDTIVLMEQAFTLLVNGTKRSFITDPRRPLLDVLREELQLTGTKYGCGEGQCRACTVLMDGKPVASCMTRVEEANGKAITTIEGISDG